MSSTLVRPALRMGKSMEDAVHRAIRPDSVTVSPHDPGPLGYLYSLWEPKTFEGPDDPANPMAGSYDRESQTWDNPDVITAGVNTNTCTGAPPYYYCGDYFVDDACM